MHIDASGFVLLRHGRGAPFACLVVTSHFVTCPCLHAPLCLIRRPWTAFPLHLRALQLSWPSTPSVALPAIDLHNIVSK